MTPPHDTPTPPIHNDHPPSHTELPARSPEEKRWRYRRFLLTAALACYFLLISCEFGPHLMLFHQWTSPTPAEVVPYIESTCVPVIRAIKEYRRDKGALPENISDLVPHYLPTQPATFFHMWTDVCETMDPRYRELIVYHFTPEAERWEARGFFVNGPIPAPLVPDPPATAPATTLK